MTLLEFQRRMSEDVRRPLTPAFAMQALTRDGRSTSKIAASYVKPNSMLTAFERLEIYNRQYWFRLIDSLTDDYPALNAVLGKKRFDALILAYLQENPSTSFTLRDLGSRLPAWLSIRPEFAGARHDLARDVARLEWAYIESFDRANLPALSSEDLVSLDGDSKLFLQPHLQLLDLKYPVDELVLAVHRETPASDIKSNAVLERKQTSRAPLPKMRRSAVHLAVHRYDCSIYYRRIDREAYLILGALQQHRTLGEAVDIAFTSSKLSPKEQAILIQDCFAHAAELGWFCRQLPDTIGAA